MVGADSTVIYGLVSVLYENLWGTHRVLLQNMRISYYEKIKMKIKNKRVLLRGNQRTHVASLLSGRLDSTFIVHGGNTDISVRILFD